MPGQTHYKYIQHKIAFQTRFTGSKSRNNALHADCCKVTIELPALMRPQQSECFCPRNRSFAQTLLKLFIMRLPCIMRFFSRYFSESSFCPRYFPVASNKAFSISSILKFRFWIKSLIVMSNLLFSSKAACVYLDVYKSRDFSFETFQAFFD